MKDKKAAEPKALMKTREEKWGELTNNLYQSGGIWRLKDEFMHLRLVELEVNGVYDNVKKFIEDLCNNVRTVVLRMLKITGLMSRLGRKETSESFLNSLTNLFFGFCKKKRRRTPRTTKSPCVRQTVYLRRGEEPRRRSFVLSQSRVL